MKIFKNILSVLLCIILFLCTIVSCVLLSCSFTLQNTKSLAEKICNESYNTVMKDNVKSEIESATMLLSFDSETFVGVVPDSEFEEASLSYTVWLLNRVINNRDDEMPTFESQRLMDAVIEALENFSVENDMKVDEGSDTEVYEYLCSKITDAMISVNDAYINKIDLTRIVKLTSFWYAPTAVCVILIVLIFLLGLKNKPMTFIKITSSVWFGSFTVHILSAMLVIKNYISNMVLSASLLREFLINIYKAFFGNWTAISGITATLALIGFIVSVIFASLPKKSQTEI